MNVRIPLTLLAAALALSACSDRTAAPPTASSTSTSSTTPEPETIIGKKVKLGMDVARRKLAAENIDLGDMHVSGHGSGISITTDGHPDEGRPKGEITPQGDLLIDGRKIPANASQHAMLLQYRKQVEGIASAGMDIGVQGAELGVKAAGEAIRGIFSGNTEDVDKHVNAEAEKIKASARKLCNQLPAMRDTQQKLAAAMPEFKPYATMEQSDIKDCLNDDEHDRQAVGDGIGDGIGDSIRNAIESADVSHVQDSSNAAAEAEAASAKEAKQQ